MAIHEQTASFDVVVVGGGFSGVCAAIAAAREGAKVALVQNRPVFGGSGSSETRMHIVGANCHSSKPNLRETGILEEILLENKRRNPYADFPVFDTIVWEKVRMEPNITILLNTNIDDVVLDGDRILAVTGCQNTTETRWTVYGKIFIDATGHGTVGVMAGAESRIGVVVAALGDRAFTAGRIEKSAVANPAAHTYDVRATLPNDGGELLPGMVCRVTVSPAGAAEEIVVPVRAVQQAGDGSRFVWTVRGDSAVRTAVTTGRLVNDGIVLTGGIAAGDRVVVDGMQKIGEGSKVTER